MKWYWIPRKLFFVLLCSVLASTGFAETLEDAWRSAMTADERLKATRMNVEANKQMLSAAKAARFPSISVESGYTILNHPPSAAISNPHFPIKQFPTAEDKGFSYRTTLSLPLFTTGHIANTIDAAKSALNTAVQEERKATLELRLSVAEAYIGILRSNRAVEVCESNVATLAAHTTDVSNLYEEGMVTRNDLLASRVSLADAKQRLTRALNDLDIARAAYNRALGRPLQHEVKIDNLTAPAVASGLDDLTEKALCIRPELESLSEQASALRFQASSLQSSSYPQVGLSSGYEYQQNKYQVYQDIWSVGVGLRWQLFDGGITRHNARALNEKAESLISIRKDAASFIALQVRQAFLDVEETLKRVSVTRDAVEQSEENLKVVKDRYREGVGTNTEVLDAETLRTRSYSNHFNAIYDSVIAEIHLRYAVGDL